MGKYIAIISFGGLAIGEIVSEKGHYKQVKVIEMSKGLKECNIYKEGSILNFSKRTNCLKDDTPKEKKTRNYYYYHPEFIISLSDAYENELECLNSSSDDFGYFKENLSLLEKYM